MSAELKTMAALFGVQEAYATSSTTLARLLPVELSPNSIRAACQDVGDIILARRSTRCSRHRKIYSAKPQPSATKCHRERSICQ